MRRLTFNPIEGSFDYVDITPTEIVAFTISNQNVWLLVPTTLQKIFNVEVFDQDNQQKIVVDFKITLGNILEVRTNKLITITIRIQGE